MIYLDHAATTPPCPQAIAAATEALSTGFANPSSLHPPGRAAAAAREAGRAVIARALGCAAEEVFFTSGGTEGDNWAVAAAAQLGQRRGRHIVTTAIEHSAVLEPVKALQARGYEVTFLKPDKSGHIDPQALRQAVREDTVLVSMMLLNNEVGSLLPVRAAREAIDAAGSPALLHTDAVQAFLKIPFTPARLGADLVTVCGHKIRAPKGIGALYIRRDLIPGFPPLLRGGGQESGLRPGTEPTAQIAAFAAAVAAWTPDTAEKLRALRDYAAGVFSSIPGVVLLSPPDAPHILAISLPDFSGQSVVEALSAKGVCVSSGSACHRGKPSHVFAAMPLPPKVRLGAVRLSFGPENTAAEVDELAGYVRSMCDRKTLLL